MARGLFPGAEGTRAGGGPGSARPWVGGPPAPAALLAAVLLRGEMGTVVEIVSALSCSEQGDGWRGRLRRRGSAHVSPTLLCLPPPPFSPDWAPWVNWSLWSNQRG